MNYLVNFQPLQLAFSGQFSTGVNNTKLYTPIDAAKRIGVKEGTLRNWRCTRKEELPFIKVGGKVMYAENDLTDFLNKKRVA